MYLTRTFAEQKSGYWPLAIAKLQYSGFGFSGITLYGY